MNEGKGSIVLKDRQELTLDGVEGVLSFDEGFVAIMTALGELDVEGAEMKIENLSKERGEIVIKGKVTALYYKEKAARRRGRG